MFALIAGQNVPLNLNIRISSWTGHFVPQDIKLLLSNLPREGLSHCLSSFFILVNSIEIKKSEWRKPDPAWLISSAGARPNNNDRIRKNKIKAVSLQNVHTRPIKRR